MGYDAYVACTCYAQGLTTPPPNPEFVVSDEYGTYLELPDDRWKAEPLLCRTMYDAFRVWKSQACAHPDLWAASARIGNSSQMYAFRSLVEEQGGPARYPVLSEQLPEYNGGSMPASYAPALLRELDALAAGPDQMLVMLREQTTGAVVYNITAGTQELFVFTAYGRYQYGLDEEGFFIAEKTVEQSEQEADYAIRFRSRSFSQQRLGVEQFRFTDLEDGSSFECNYGLLTDEFDDTMTTFGLGFETLPLAQVYVYTLTALRKLAEAAIVTGHPICWT